MKATVQRAWEAWQEVRQRGQLEPDQLELCRHVKECCLYAGCDGCPLRGVQVAVEGQVKDLCFDKICAW